MFLVNRGPVALHEPVPSAKPRQRRLRANRESQQALDLPSFMANESEESDPYDPYCDGSYVELPSYRLGVARMYQRQEEMIETLSEHEEEALELPTVNLRRR